MIETLGWIATAATIIAACMTAANLGARITGYGFAVFLVGSVTWLATALMEGDRPLMFANGVLTLLNIFGIWRWLGRQAKVEEGAQTASERSQKSPGETLFPVTLLTGGTVVCDGKDVAQCVEAMAACGTGTIAYVVISEGGVAGVGETLRLLPWAKAQVDGDKLVADLHDGIDALQVVERDKWPAR